VVLEALEDWEAELADLAERGRLAWWNLSALILVNDADAW
jgi:hypothetical protein